MQSTNNEEIRDAVRAYYAGIAISGASGCGCSPSSGGGCCATEQEPVHGKTSSEQMGYTSKDLEEAPEQSNLGLGCGNPQAIANLKEGESVLDLGSGAGFDCFLAARQVGRKGKVIGVDMTPAMISKARQNAVKADYTNVEFRLGEIEQLPVADSSIDVIISNCVINLSPDKPAVFREAMRVLKPGGRLAISDIITRGPMPDELKNNQDYLCGCISGAPSLNEVKAMLGVAGFTEIRITTRDESREFIKEWVPGMSVEQFIVSAAIEGRKPRP